MEHEFQPIWVAGFMSGTSLDGVDGAMLLTDGEKITQFGAVTDLEYSASERQILADATDAARHWNWLGDMPEQLFEQARQVINTTHYRAWQNLLGVHNSSLGRQNASARPTLVGVHGQTVLHRRPTAGRRGATLQLMDGAGFAARLGCPVAYDFRVDDVAAGGEGAPLAPAYHRALLEQLGPAPEAPNAQAIHVAALLNPIVPVNDDFLFIRPAVMTARSTANRLDHAERGLRDAIKRLS